MTIKERIFQAILFETIAVILSLFLVKLLMKQSQSSDVMITGMLIAISLIAMIWTFIFNWLFDRVFTGEKVQRSVKVRVLHVILFEGGLLIFTLPLIAFVLKINLWQAFLMDIALTLFILVYAFVFYWIYDHIRARLMKTH